MVSWSNGRYARTLSLPLLVMIAALAVDASHVVVPLLDLQTYELNSNSTNFNYVAFKQEDDRRLKLGQEYKFLVDASPSSLPNSTTNGDDESKTHLNCHHKHHHLHNVQHTVSKRDLYTKQLTASNVRVDTYELDHQKKRQLMATANINVEKNDDEDKSNGICLYSNIKSKINECFDKNAECNQILECISSLNLVDVCRNFDMYTPTVWILNVFNILKTQSFCSIPLQCELNPNDNEYLRRLDNIVKFTYDYGPVYLDKPKFDNKKYCSKSHNLVSSVIDSIDSIDNCFDSTVISQIRAEIDDSASHILDRNCPYCISANLNFDECVEEKYLTCNETFKCITEKIDLYKCESDPDTTALTLIASFLKNVTFICDQIASEKNESFEEIKDWLYGIDLCMNERHFLGLTYNEAPPNIDFCHDLDETFKCIYSNHRAVLKFIPKLKAQFDHFANLYNRLQRTCEVTSLSKLTTVTNAVTRHAFQNNSEQTVIEDNKNYYHQTVVRAELNQIINWINIDAPQFAQYQVKRDHDLSKNYLKATIVKLKFKFPYYGHMLDQVVVATGGFLYVGSLMNPLITKAQYIAPLMANFDPTLNNRSIIKYVDNTTHFICTWENLLLQDQKDNGEYTFQVVLNSDGRILFNYKKIPSLNISNSNHTVKIGLSDAYIFYKLLSSSKIEYTIVQYHVINISPDNVKTGNSIMFFMLKNCLQMKTCEECVRGVPNFKCIWCPILQRCSDTIDRYRQEWVELSCPMDYNSQSNSTCLINQAFNRNAMNLMGDTEKMTYEPNKETEYVKSVVVGIFFTILISMLLTTVGWAFYAYKNPNSPSGIWLIEHRPMRLVAMISNRFNKDTANMSRFENPVA